MPWWNLWSSSDSQQPQHNEGIAERTQDNARSLASTIERDVNSISKNLRSNDGSVWHIFTETQTIAAAAILTAACLGSFKFYSTYLRRIPEAININQSYFHRRSIFGKVTRVGDGDNFRIYHTPGGRLAGWGWLPWRRVPTDRKLLKNNTIHIRIAGVDAPELAHFGRPAQPYSEAALKWLTSYVIGRRVRAYVYKIDQYSRVVATAYVWKGLLRRDVGLEMIRAGFATVYEAKSGAEFGKDLEGKYRNAEQWAKLRKKGMWAGEIKDYESPREYKNKYRVYDDVDKQ